MATDPTTEDSGLFNVYSLTSALPAYQQCRIYSEGSMYPSIYSLAYGPALQDDCKKWVAEHCSGATALDTAASDTVDGTGPTLEDAILDANGKFETGGADIEIRSEIVNFGATSGGFTDAVSYWVTARKIG